MSAVYFFVQPPLWVDRNSAGALENRSITPGDQLWVNLGDVIHGGIADDEGRTFPSDVTGGSYELSQAQDGTLPSLFEGKIIVDKTFGHLTYGCLECCTQTRARMLDNPENLALNGQDDMGVQALDSCFGDWMYVDSQYSTWDTHNHAVATMSTTRITGVGIGNTDAFANGYLIGQSPRLCTHNPSAPAAPANVVSVQITGADLESNYVNITLSGPSGVSGTLTATANGSGHHVQISANNGNPVGPGSYQLSFNRPSMPADTYTSVTAQWNIGAGFSKTLNLSRTWWVQGYTEHTQYNTPAESTCATAQGTAFIFVPSNCSFTQVNMRSQFISQAHLNGSGVADASNHGLLHADQGQCAGHYPQGASSANSFFSISSVTGSCNQVLTANSVATNPNPQQTGSPWNCGDNLLVVNSSNANVGIYDVLDYCPACSAWDAGYSAHVDHYSSSNACALASLPGNWAADTH